MLFHLVGGGIVKSMGLGSPMECQRFQYVGKLGLRFPDFTQLTINYVGVDTRGAYCVDG
jgi:hypothetical protein